ncbi:MFS transporter [Streptomyces pactum]|uniref:MFS transporter n=1 Tax=Streptomyces pactum TaxID=68249 RepID=A0ABS0NM47_9ACTN|nr:MFS transporter [Streptomyces pactum]MBH5336284.1 MFS transporter [Streptomyces pactum]
MSGARPRPSGAAETAGLDPRTARRRFVAVSFLFWLPLGLYIAPHVLLLTERGLALSAVAVCFAAHSTTVAVLELPTGGFSDAMGRRVVLAAAGLLNLAALVLQGLGTTLWVLVLANVLMGSGRALSSGPAEAWYVDTVHAHSGPGAEIRTGIARGHTAAAVALAVGTLLGGLLPWLLGLGADPGSWLRDHTSGLVLPLSVPMLVGAAVAAGFVAYVLTALPEPPRPRATLGAALRGVPATVAAGVRLGARDAVLRRVLLTAGAVATGLVTIELLAPGRVADTTGAAESGAVVFAGLAAAGFAVNGLGSHLAPATVRFAGGRPERAVLVALGAAAAGLVLLGATAATGHPLAPVAAVTGYLLVYVGLGAAGPNENELMHHRVDTTARATALSLQSLSLQFVGGAAGFVAGGLPTGPLPWLFGAVVVAGGALLWAGRTPAGPPAAAGSVPSSGAVTPAGAGPTADGVEGAGVVEGAEAAEGAGSAAGGAPAGDPRP